MPTIVQFRLKELMAETERRSGQRVTYRGISEATGLSTNTLTLMAQNKLKQVGLSTIARLCDYFECEPGTLMVLTSAVSSREEPLRRR
jgi:putative transcriptional regulator